MRGGPLGEKVKKKIYPIKGVKLTRVVNIRD